uniref:Uncharacterized protein n=1 Tax=Nelumbo nucifera TaxID=4432 RepID=A0A822YYX2_NELNU|nr:TPA_asm: hypothetical protein HUJ06_013617 [Nelumbo nucifera]
MAVQLAVESMIIHNSPRPIKYMEPQSFLAFDDWGGALINSDCLASIKPNFFFEVGSPPTLSLWVKNLGYNFLMQL